MTINYLQEGLNASQITWMLGFRQKSSVTQACGRWTEKPLPNFVTSMAFVDDRRTGLCSARACADTTANAFGIAEQTIGTSKQAALSIASYV